MNRLEQNKKIKLLDSVKGVCVSLLGKPFSHTCDDGLARVDLIDEHEEEVAMGVSVPSTSWFRSHNV